MCVILRCLVDNLLLEAQLHPGPLALIVIDGDEAFTMEAVEAAFYEVVSATPEELVGIEQAGYRLLKAAPDFESLRQEIGKSCCKGYFGERHRIKK